MSETRKKLILITAILNTALISLYCIIALSLVLISDIYISGKPDSSFSTFYFFIVFLSYVLVPAFTVVISTTILLFSSYLKTDNGILSPLIYLVSLHSAFTMVSALIYNYAGIVLGLCFVVLYSTALFPIEDRKPKTVFKDTKSQKITFSAKQHTNDIPQTKTEKNNKVATKNNSQEKSTKQADSSKKEAKTHIHKKTNKTIFTGKLTKNKRKISITEAFNKPPAEQTAKENTKDKIKKLKTLSSKDFQSKLLIKNKNITIKKVKNN